MAKSARSSVRKTNKSRLKSRVFGPAEAARTKRLSEKLAALASLPTPKKADKTATSDVDMDKDQPQPDLEKESVLADEATMDVDDATATTTDPKTVSRKEEKRRKEAKSARVEKKRHRKSTNRMTFPKTRSQKASK